MRTLAQLVKRGLFSNLSLAVSFYKFLDLARARRVRAGATSYGQCNEDAWFSDWLANQNFPWARNGFYVDIGANHPVLLSATYLLYRLGWGGLTVEPIPGLCALHKKIRPRDICINAGVGAASGMADFWETVPHVFSSFSHADAVRAEKNGWCRIVRKARVPILTPAQILQQAGLGKSAAPNYLAIDTEGLDMEILKCWPMGMAKPDVISCEVLSDHDNSSPAMEILKARGYCHLKSFHTVGFVSLCVAREIKAAQ